MGRPSWRHRGLRVPAAEEGQLAVLLGVRDLLRDVAAVRLRLELKVAAPAVVVVARVAGVEWKEREHAFVVKGHEFRAAPLRSYGLAW